MDLEEIREKFKEEIESSERRKRFAYSFQEPDRVPIMISAGGSYYAHLFGYDIKDYYKEIDIQIDVQLKSIQWRFENLGDDNTSTTIGLDIGPIQEALYFDCPIVRPKGTSPRIVHILEEPKDIEKLRVPEPEDCPGLKWLDRQFQMFVEIAKKKKVKQSFPSGPRLQIHPPLSSACAIMSPTKVYLLMAEEPKLVKLLLEKMFIAFCKLVDYYDRRYGTRTTSISLANDNSCFISNNMYVEQVLPYDKAIYEQYGKGWRSLHTDGPSDHNFKTFADELKLNFMDIGGWSSIDVAVSVMKGKVIIHGGLNCKDVYGPLDEEAKRKIDHALRVAGPGGGYEFAIGGETYVGVPPETLIELVEYVKERGHYPISTLEG